MYAPGSAELRLIRERIASDHEDLRGIVAAPDFKQAFGDIRGVTLKRIPQGFPRDHPAAGLTATENMFIFRSRRYETHPLIVRGPGAGAQVTAAGVFSDVLRAHAERRVA